eukprot:169644-Alexandrium_andersonii.AAC.1
MRHVHGMLTQHDMSLQAFVFQLSKHDRPKSARHTYGVLTTGAYRPNMSLQALVSQHSKSDMP